MRPPIDSRVFFAAALRLALHWHVPPDAGSYPIVKKGVGKKGKKGKKRETLMEWASDQSAVSVNKWQEMAKSPAKLLETIIGDCGNSS